jgi:acyl carrier protein
MSLKSRIRKHVAEAHLPGEDPEALDMEEDLILSGILDSLGLVQLTAHLEEAYGVVVAPDEITSEHFRTVARIAALVERKSDPKHQEASLDPFDIEIAPDEIHEGRFGSVARLTGFASGKRANSRAGVIKQ